MQSTLMPFVLSSESSSSPPETQPLCLPSSFTVRHTALPPSMLSLPRLQETEAQLRFAHAAETLDELRRHLMVQVHYSQYTRTNVRGQSANTRSQSLQKQTQSKIKVTVQRYRRVRAAYFALVGKGNWENELRVLEDGDICPLSENHISREGGSGKLGEGHKKVSWIWYTYTSHEDSLNQVNEGKPQLLLGYNVYY